MLAKETGRATCGQSRRMTPPVHLALVKYFNKITCSDIQLIGKSSLFFHYILGHLPFNRTKVFIQRTKCTLEVRNWSSKHSFEIEYFFLVPVNT